METQIKKILVPVDFSETSLIALNQAVSMAKKMQAHLHLLHVIDDAPLNISTGVEIPVFVPLTDTKELEKSAEKQLEELQATIFVKYNFATWSHIRKGYVGATIIEFAIQEKIDLIIMGTHGVSGYKEFLLGSNSQKVAENSKVPVITFQEDKKDTQFKNIVVPINNSLHSREKVNTIVEIASAYGSKIHILGITGAKEDDEYNKVLLKIETVAKFIRYTGLPYILKMIDGKHFAEETLQYAKKNKCDLIVVNTGDESKIEHEFLRIFSGQIINHSKIPVLSVKPTEGHFESIPLIGYGNPMLY